MTSIRPVLTHGDPSSLGIARCFLTSIVSVQFRSWPDRLLDSDRLGQIAREVNVETLRHSQPVSHQLERNDVEQTLENIAGLGDLDTLGLLSGEFGVTSVADDNGSTRTGND